MVSQQLSQVVRQLRRAVSLRGEPSPSDAQLLEHFACRRDEQAFELLVSRHGPMVLALCRRLLRDAHDAEDAFQATFLLLVRKADSLRERDLLGNWLYGVAYRVAVRARATRARRRAVERAAGEMAARAAQGAPAGQELGWLIHEELSRLPEKYRRPLVLCYLEGKSNEEAARRLHWPVGTVKGRLTRARALLRRRLARQGVTLFSGVLAAALSPNLAAALPPPLIVSTVKAALTSAAGGAAAPGGISVSALALVHGTLRAMRLARLKAALALVLAVTVLIPGAGMLVHGVLTQPDDVTAPASQPAKRATTPREIVAEALEERVDLKARFVEGQAFYQEVKIETKQVLKVMQMEINQQQSQTLWIRVMPLGKKDGNFLVQLKIVGIKLNLDVGANKVRYDSTVRNQPINELTNFCKTLHGAEFMVLLNGDATPGKYLRLIEVEGRQALIQKLAGDESGQRLLKTFLSEEAFKELANPLAGVLPGRVVRKGHTWTASARQDRGPIGQYLTHYQYTYQGRTGELDRIKFKTTLDYTPPRTAPKAELPFTILKANLKSRDGSGVAAFDRALGHIAQASLDTRLAGTLVIEIGGLSTEVDLDQTQRTTIKITDSDPLK